MIAIKECFKNLIGLSRIDCDCFDGIKPELKKSELALYLDEHLGVDLKLIENTLGCGEDMQTDFLKIYATAVNFFEGDLQVAISENHQQRFKPYYGTIGRNNYSSPIAKNKPVQGVKITAKPLEGASMVIDSINLFFSSAGIVRLKLYKNTAELASFEIEVQLGVTTFSFPEPLNLALYENANPVEYLFVYDTTDLKPLENTIFCGSCGNTDTTRKNFIEVAGVAGTDIHNLNSTNAAYGLSINTTISCSIQNMICPAMKDELFKRRAGMAVWYKMGQLFLGKVLRTRNINFDTLTNREQIIKDEAILKNNYKSLVTWLAENSEIKQSECFVCHPEQHISVGKILL